MKQLRKPTRNERITLSQTEVKAITLLEELTSKANQIMDDLESGKFEKRTKGVIEVNKYTDIIPAALQELIRVISADRGIDHKHDVCQFVHPAGYSSLTACLYEEQSDVGLEYRFHECVLNNNRTAVK